MHMRQQPGDECIYVAIRCQTTDLTEMFLLQLLSFQGLFLFLFSGPSPPFWPYRCSKQAWKVTLSTKYHTRSDTGASLWRNPSFMWTFMAHPDEMLHPQLRFWDRQNDMDARFGCRAVRTQTEEMVGRRTQMWDRVDETDRQRDLLEYWATLTWWMFPLGSLLMSKFLLNVKYTEQHDVRQTGQNVGLKSVSVISVHLWRYCVS